MNWSRSLLTTSTPCAREQARGYIDRGTHTDEAGDVGVGEIDFWIAVDGDGFRHFGSANVIDAGLCTHHNNVDPIVIAASDNDGRYVFEVDRSDPYRWSNRRMHLRQCTRRFDCFH